MMQAHCSDRRYRSDCIHANLALLYFSFESSCLCRCCFSEFQKACERICLWSTASFFFLISDLQTDINRNFCGAPFKPDQLAGSTLHSLIHSKTPRVVKLHRSSEIWRTLSYGTLHGLLTMARGCTLTPWSITCIVLVCSTRPQPSNWHWASPFPQQGSKELKEALEVLLWENGTKSLGQP